MKFRQNTFETLLFVSIRLPQRSCRLAKTGVYLWLISAKVANTGCPITMLILKNKPNFPCFWPKNHDYEKKQTQFKPNSNPNLGNL
jgi:hypothetical protein